MIFARLDSGFIAVGGEDRTDFVQGLLSNDVRSLNEGEGTGALLLNHRGHALAQLTVLRLEDVLLLAVEDGKTELVLQEFERHIIFDQVELRLETGSWTQLTVQAETAGQLAAAAGAADDVVAVVARKRTVAGGMDLFLRGDGGPASEAVAALGAREATSVELDAERVRALVAAAAFDAGEGVLPQEAGLEHLVSYRKGCYLGQEIMARIEARGNLRRGLQQLRLSGPPSGDNREIRRDGRLVGRLGTLVQDATGSWSALAVLRLDLPAGTELETAGTTALVSA